MPDWSKIKLLVLDFDGVMTDNKVYVDQDGRESVCCSRGDGLGIEMARKAGLEIMVISKETNSVVKARCEKLKIEVLHGIDDKLPLLKAEIDKRSLDAAAVCYVGNDVNDIECIKHVGAGCAVADALPEVLEAADFVTSFRGGNGAVREVCDLIRKNKM